MNRPLKRTLPWVPTQKDLDKAVLTEQLWILETYDDTGDRVDTSGSPLSAWTNTIATLTRDEEVIRLFWIGMVHRTILQYINAKADANNWEKFWHESQVRRIVTKYYKKYQNTSWDVYAAEDEQALKEAYYLQQEKLVEDLLMFISEQKKNKKIKIFEYVQAMETVWRIRQQMIENRNWNDSRKNPLAVGINVNNMVGVFENASGKMLVEWPSNSMRNVMAYLKDRFESDAYTPPEKPPTNPDGTPRLDYLEWVDDLE